ncbi:hypothetical protein ACHAXA_007266 [Cyclostephanos tholiformis]|uniref:DUF6314 domain-containing protein n=1 Tax=Cyclostephanos tholiformis TaxID=382380 RepID=A0ABD3SGV9_9STRA
MLEVAVIGAGASGLVAARQLINAGLRPTIFEVAKTVGGAWTPSPSSESTAQCTKASSLAPYPPPRNPSDERNAVGIRSTSPNRHPASKMWKGMSTNLSKFTCRFSDWPWPEDASTFPSVEEMHEYLESYAAACLSPSCDFQFECNVFNVEQLEGPHSSQDPRNNYKVEWIDLTTKTSHCRDFGGVVVATGFFHTPRFPSFLTKKNGSGENNKSFGGNIKPQMMHSTDYKNHHSFKGKHVAVIGSSFSALEIASDLSRSVARVVNVSPSVPWVLPRWIPTVQPLQSKGQKNGDITAITILPADLVLYRRHQSYPKTPETISLTPEQCRERHKYLQSLVGHRQSHSTLGEPTNFDEPPFVAISDEYLDLVREDKIEVIRGRLVGVDDDGRLEINVTQSNSDNLNPQPHTTLLDEIDDIICCTGFVPLLHEFLSPGILSTINYDPQDNFAPVTLAWDILHPSLPNLAFCGMYRGPYMGIMELQARLAAGVLSGRISLDVEQTRSALMASEAIRKATPRAQFPHFDYIGYMDTLSQLCYQGDYPRYNLQVGDAVVPTFYQPDDGLSQQCLSDIEKELFLGQDGSRTPRMVLQSILGKWTYDRHIVHMQTRKVERVYGTVKYSKYWCRSNPESKNDDNAVEFFSVNDTEDKPVLYREDGLYELTPTQKFEVFREYEYVCKNDVLEIYFVEGGRRAHLFLSLKFVPETIPVSNSLADESFWVRATSDHLCVKDLYSATFRVKFNGLSASEIIIKYQVKGPSKDYESTTILRPQS